MIRIETYFDDNDLKIHLFNEDDNQSYFINDEDAYKLIKQLYNNKLINYQDNGKDALFVFDNYKLKINDYEKILKNNKLRELFSPIYLKTKRFLELQKVEKLKKRKVNRINKYIKVGFTALGITACILSAANVKALQKKVELPKVQDPITNLNNNFKGSYSKAIESMKASVKDYEETKNDTEMELDSPNEEEAIVPQQIDDTEEVPIVESQDNNETIIDDTGYEFVSLDYNDRSSSDKAISTDDNYRNTIEKYAKMYGIDANLMLAIATQESGDHYGNLESGPAIGLMQIEKSVWEYGGSLTAFNFETNSWETITVTPDDYNNFIYNLRDLDYNVKIGCMMFQQSLVYMNYNVLAALQCYNMGYGNMQSILDNYCMDEGLNKDYVLDNQYDDGWLRYRDYIAAGDPSYIENVLSYCGKEYTIKVTKPDGKVISVNISGNNLQKVH